MQTEKDILIKHLEGQIERLKPKHISSHFELEKGKYYWIKIGDQWFPALYRFNDNFVIDGTIAITANSLTIDKIEPLTHD